MKIGDPKEYYDYYIGFSALLSYAGEIEAILAKEESEEKQKLKTELTEKMKNDKAYNCFLDKGLKILLNNSNKEMLDFIAGKLGIIKKIIIDDRLTSVNNSEESIPTSRCSSADALKYPDVLNKLAWLEHRRWTAFMRTQGFRCPTQDEEESYIASLDDDTVGDGKNKGKHKNLELKLHPCIVEYARTGQKADLFNSDKADDDDMLDCVSRRFRESYTDKRLDTYDFKMYDYPEYE